MKIMYNSIILLIFVLVPALSYVPNDKGLKLPIDWLNILKCPLSPNPSLDQQFSNVNYHRRGMLWNLYSMKLPLAWEITKGDSTIVIGDCDDLEDDYNHPDMIKNYKIYTGDGITTGNLASGHGMITMSTAIADDNNYLPMVGTCPDCNGFIISAGNSILSVDIDRNVNGIKTRPHVFYKCNGVSSNINKDVIENGIVYLVAWGNGMLLYPQFTSVKGITYPYPPEYGTFRDRCFEDPNVSSANRKVVKQINIAGLMDGVLTDIDKLGTGINPNYPEISYKGNESFISFNTDGIINNLWCFSRGYNKFSNTKDVLDNYKDRDLAGIDLVVPALDIFDLNYFDITHGGSTHKHEYEGSSGTSQRVAMAAGVVGLMRSVNEFMRLDVGTSGVKEPINLIDIHRNTYDIMTFTADKISDIGFFPETIKKNWSSTTLYKVPKFAEKGGFWDFTWQTSYKPYVEDDLNRTWAQRMGFGKLNAYRSVAHSIRQKGDYKYTFASNTTITMASDNGSGDSKGYVNPSGNKLMHWGSKIKEGTGAFEIPINRGPSTSNDGILNVIEWGGTSLPGEYHNNQGVTIVNDDTSGGISKRAVIVAPNDILAIDGILLSEQPDAENIVYTGFNSTTQQEGKILIEGLVKNIEVFGNIRTGDVIVDGVYPSSHVPGCLGFLSKKTTSPVPCEMLGKIKTINGGLAYVNGNTTMYPGASVELRGVRDFVVDWGAELTMNSATEFKGDIGRKLELFRNGEYGTTTLRVVDSAIVDIDVIVHVQNNCELIIGHDAICRIKQLIVDPGGKVTVKQGATLSLEASEHFINGHLNISEQGDVKAKLVGNNTFKDLPMNFTNYPVLSGGTLSGQYIDKYNDFNNITTTPVIYMKTENCDLANTSLKLKNTILRNISINTQDVRIIGEIKDCEFYSNTRTFNPYFHLDYFLSLNQNICDDCNDATLYNNSVKFSNCVVKEVIMSEPNPSQSSNWNKLIFRTGGLKVEGFNSVLVEDCSFKNLEFGLATYNCTKVKLSGNTFDSCGIGDYSFASSNELCNNIYTVVQNGSVRDNCLIGKAFSNSYNIVRKGYTIISSDEQRFRNNNFKNYLQGIASFCSKAVLGDVIENNVRYLYGRNQFNPINSSTNSTNNYLLTCDNGKSTDIYLKGSCCALTLRCGKNKFSENATYNISYDGVGTFGPIDVSYNAFPPTFNVRKTTNVATIKDVSSTLTMIEYDNTLTYCCGDYTVVPAGSLTNCDFVIDGGTKTCVSSTLTMPNYSGGGEFNKDDKSPKVNNFDLDKLDNLIKNEPNKNVAIINALNLIKNESNNTKELIHLSDKIKNISDISSLDGSNNMKAYLNYLILKSKKIKSDYISEYNKLTNAKENNIQESSKENKLIDYVNGISDTFCEVVNSDVEELDYKEFTVGVPNPNPFTSETKIDFTLPDNFKVTAEVFSLTGNKILTLINNETMAKGLHSIFLTSEKLSSGVYYIKITAGTQSIVREVIFN